MRGRSGSAAGDPERDKKEQTHDYGQSAAISAQRRTECE